MSETSESVDRSLESLVGRVADEFLRRQRNGESPDVEEYVARYPEAADLLRPALASLRLLDCSKVGHEAAAEDVSDEVRGTLGDFRILREVGRGGMGVVYEAEQLSLNRRVALKVLPWAATLDARQLQRFQNEARAAAGLHHTNVVPVYFVGSERGVHYYAMQFIEGRNLASIVAQLRQQSAPRATGPESAPTVDGAEGEPVVGAAVAAGDTGPIAGLTTESPTRSREYFRTVARLGVQAAEALDHAHQMGIVHRDVKPANLLVDATGRLWVADFGLAQVQSDARLTRTGDLVGTLRYMSPEQALAQRLVLDHRTDVYSLGATLYELLTLRPAFTGNDRQELLRQIAFEEPTRPRRLNQRIPVELETIVLKAMEKNLQERYATAQELADDLRRYLEDRPIKARRPSWRQVAAKWARRHKTLVWAALVASLVLLVFGGGVGLWRLQQRVLAAKEASIALSNANDLDAEGKLPQALLAVRRAEPLRKAGLLNEELARQVQERQTDLEMLDRLDEIRLRQAAFTDNHSHHAIAVSAYEQAFQDYGIDVLGLTPEEAGERLQGRAIAQKLAAALQHWSVACYQTRPNDDAWRRLLAVARNADPDDWREQLRGALVRRDKNSLVELAVAEQSATLSPAVVVLLGDGLRGTGALEEAVTLLRRARRKSPHDFWINFKLARYLSEMEPAQLEESIRFYTAAQTLRPHSAGVRLNLGNALLDLGRLEEAREELHVAIKLDPTLAAPHNSLGKLFHKQGRLERAEDEYRQAIQLDPTYAPAHNGLGSLRYEQRRFKDAEQAFREAIQLDPEHAFAHTNLGNALRAQHRDEEAEVEYRLAVKLDPDYAKGHLRLGELLQERGQLEQAAREYHRAIQLQPRNASFHSKLAITLSLQKQVKEAEEEFRLAIDCDPKNSASHCNLGNFLHRQGRLEEAKKQFREAIAIDDRNASAHGALGAIWFGEAHWKEAEEEFRQAVALNPGDARLLYNLALSLYKQNQRKDADQTCRAAVNLVIKQTSGLQPQDVVFLNSMGSTLGTLGWHSEAEQVFRIVSKLTPTAPAYYNLARALATQHKDEEAVTAYRKAIERNPDFAEAHCNLANVLEHQGRFAEALASVRRGHDLGSRKPNWSFPSAEWVRKAEKNADLEIKLLALLKGEYKPQDNNERLLLTHVSHAKQMHRTTAKLYADAFAAEPEGADDLKMAGRYNAACSAALAADGKGVDTANLDASEKKRLREQARLWLEAQHKQLAGMLASPSPRLWVKVRDDLGHWQQDSDLAGVRGDALARLPEEERQAWQKLWSAITDTLASARKNTALEEKSEMK